MKRTLLVLTFAISIASRLSAQGASAPLDAARELYASARYDEALAVLNGLKPADAATPIDRRAIQQYRSLCLLALGRGAEAENAIAALVTADPMYLPTDEEASPRVRSAFSEVRQRVLPGIAVSLYAAAKRLYDGKQYAAAIEEFRHVLRLLDDQDMKGQHGDLRVLASGFLDLSVAAATPPDLPKREVAMPVGSATAAAGAPVRVYTADDAGVNPAVAIKQELPKIPSTIATQVRDRGVLEVVIDELGRVSFAAIRSSLHPMYDNLVLTSARDWRYRPATLNGTAVKYRKLIQISLAKR